MKSSRLLLALSLALSLAVTLGAVGASAIGGIGGRPANPDPNNPRSQSIFIHTAMPGEKIQDVVKVVNSSDKKRTILIYPVDGVATNTGAYTCRQKAEQLLQSGAWIKLDKTEVTLEPKTDIDIPFTITVPEAVDVGEHNACIVFEDAEDDSVTEKTEAGGVKIQSRQAIRVATTIPGDLKREVAINNFSVTPDGEGRVKLGAVVSNKGNVSADVDIRMALVNRLNNQTVYTNGGVYPVLANNDFELNFVSDNQNGSLFWGGWYKGTLNVRYNTNPSKLGFDEVKDTMQLEPRVVNVFVRPTKEALLIIAGMILLLCSLIGLLLKHRHDEKEKFSSWRDYVASDGDTMELLIEGTNATWKDFVKINKLPAPYLILEGQRLKIPKLLVVKPKPTEYQAANVATSAAAPGLVEESINKMADVEPDSDPEATPNFESDPSIATEEGVIADIGAELDIPVSENREIENYFESEPDTKPESTDLVRDLKPKQDLRASSSDSSARIFSAQHGVTIEPPSSAVPEDKVPLDSDGLSASIDDLNAIISDEVRKVSSSDMKKSAKKIAIVDDGDKQKSPKKKNVKKPSKKDDGKS